MRLKIYLGRFLTIYDCVIQIIKHLSFYSCLACATGFIGINCDIKCPLPMYGQNCQLMCNCSDKACDHVTGCKLSSKSKHSFLSYYLNQTFG